MARKSIQSGRTVAAINIDTGKTGLVSKKNAVEIPVVPQIKNPWGRDGIPVIPASARMFAHGSQPTKIIEITLRELPQGGHWLHVRYETTAQIQYTKPDGTPVYMYTGGCYVRHERDARDPWFDTLPASDKARMLAALAPAAEVKS